MPVHALLFEVESIQAYITDSGRLADAVSASARVDQLCGDLVEPGEGQLPSDLLSAVLRCVGATVWAPGDSHSVVGDVCFSRRGGGAFIAFFGQATLRDRVQALWSAALAEVAPGLRFGLAAADGANELVAAEAGRVRMRALRNESIAVLPEAGPLTRRTPRTGRAAVEPLVKGDGREWVDAQTAVHSGYRQRIDSHDSLTARFSTVLENWPRNLEEDFPLLANGHSEIAMMHADGNGLGVALQALESHCRNNPSAYVQAYAGFSRAVTIATQAAAAAATHQVLQQATIGFDGDRSHTDTGKQPFVPARPLVLGGDDLTVLLRPDLAIPFTRVFLQAFEVETKKALRTIRQQFDFLPESLSAAAGIAIVRAGHPFDRAMDLAEALCKAVKAKTKPLAPMAKEGKSGAPAPSGLMFYRQTTSLLDDWDDILAVETSSARGAHHYRTVHGPYLLQPHDGSGLPTLAQLQALRDVLVRPSMARGPLRQLITQLHQTPETALASWNRVWEMLAFRDPDGRQALSSALHGLRLPTEPGQLPVAPRELGSTLLHTPLGDALTLAHLEEHRLGEGIQHATINPQPEFQP